MNWTFGPSPRRTSALLAASVALALGAIGGANAQFDPLRKALKPEQREAARTQAQQALVAESTIKGPAVIEINAAVAIDLPAGFSFVPARTANTNAKAGGNVSDDVVGRIVADSDAAEAIELDYRDGPHVEDDGDKASSPDGWKAVYERGLIGASGARVDSFASEPAYDAQIHRFTFGANFKAGDGSGAPAGSLFEAFQFGREGYVRWVAAASAPLNSQRLDIVTRALDALRFKPGQAYEDYDAKSSPASTLTVAGVVSPSVDPANAQTAGLVERLKASGFLTPLLFLLASAALGFVAFIGWVRHASGRRAAREFAAGGSAMTRFDKLNKSKST